MAQAAGGWTGDIAVVQDNRSGQLSYWQGRDHHSIADRHGVSLASYVHALLGLLSQKKSRRVLMVGCGGGSLATMLARDGAAVTVLDVDEQSFGIARRYFHMPPSVECRVGDGLKFLRRNSGRLFGRYDAIVLDAFSEGQIPYQFLTPNFHRLAKARLRRGGIILVNMVARDGTDPLLSVMARAMRAAWRQPRLLDTKSSSNRNVIAMAGAVRDLKAPRVIVKPVVRARQLAKTLARYFLRPLR